jgi:hypothetical protein
VFTAYKDGPRRQKYKTTIPTPHLKNDHLPARPHQCSPTLHSSSLEASIGTAFKSFKSDLKTTRTPQYGQGTPSIRWKNNPKRLINTPVQAALQQKYKTL